MIEMQRKHQPSLCDKWIAEEACDLHEAWMLHADEILASLEKRVAILIVN